MAKIDWTKPVDPYSCPDCKQLQAHLAEAERVHQDDLAELDRLAGELNALEKRWKKDDELLRNILDAAVKVRSVMGCAGRGCFFRPPDGIATNGGCRCLQSLSSRQGFFLRQLYALAMRASEVSADREGGKKVEDG